MREPDYNRRKSLIFNRDSSLRLIEFGLHAKSSLNNKLQKRKSRDEREINLYSTKTEFSLSYIGVGKFSTLTIRFEVVGFCIPSR